LPRLIIKRIITPLIELKNLYAEQRFPPKEILTDVSPKVDLTNWLNENVPNQETRERMASLITCWAGNPNSVQELSKIPSIYFSIFNLELPDINFPGVDTPPAPRNGGGTVPTPPDESGPKSTPTGHIENRDNVFEQWNLGSEMPQEEARVLRNEIDTLLKNSIDWFSLNMRKSQKPLFVSIPNSKGEGRGRGNVDTITIDNSNEKNDGKLRKAFGALWRHKHNKYYVKKAEDTITILNFIDELRIQYIEILKQEEENDLIFLVQKIKIQNKILGISDKRRFSQQCDEFIEADSRTHISTERWTSLRKTTRDMRPILVQALHDIVGLYQGKGKTTFAFDHSKLNRIASNSKEGISVPIFLEKEKALKEHIKSLDNIRLQTAMKDTISAIKTIHGNLENNLGSDFNQSQFIKIAESLIEELQKISGGYPQQDFPLQDQKTKLTWFASLDFKKLNNDINRLPKNSLTAENISEFLKPLGQINTADLVAIDAFFEHWNRFLKISEANLEQAGAGGDLDLVLIGSQFKEELLQIKGNLQVICKNWKAD
jgi:hypothetical protein